MRKKNEIRGIFFDLGGVLVEKSKHNKVFKDNIARLHIPAQAFGRIARDEIAALEKGKESSAKFWRHLARRLHVAPLPARAASSLFRESYKKHARINRRVLAVAQQLRAHGYPVGIISNTIDDHTVVMKKWKLFQYFDPVLLSNEIGLRKPERKIFRLASRKIGIPPENLLFIDDTPYCIAGARKCGFKTILFKSSVQLRKRLKALGVLG